jgi:aminoglycoside phosphotransferase (APT) family kinase protein
MDRERMEYVLAASGIGAERLRSYEELTGGTFNSAYRLQLADGTVLVLKVAPDPAAPVMSYERGLMRTEERFYRAAQGRVPVPTVVHADYGRDVLGGDWLLMTLCPGQNWHTADGRIGAAQRARLRGELGGLAARLHQVTGPGFGYPQVGLAADWRSAFTAMMEAVLADADRFAAPLPVPTELIAGLVHAQAHLLDDVGTPVLVHFDLWPGNILIDASEAGPVIGGLVDGERAFWGDPLAEMVSVALFGDIESDAGFLQGYHAAGGVVDFDARTRRRLALYRCYLYLIMLIETVPRGTQGEEREPVLRMVRRELATSLAMLGWAGEA